MNAPVTKTEGWTKYLRLRRRLGTVDGPPRGWEGSNRNEEDVISAWRPVEEVLVQVQNDYEDFSLSYAMHRAGHIILFVAGLICAGIPAATSACVAATPGASNSGAMSALTIVSSVFAAIYISTRDQVRFKRLPMYLRAVNELHDLHGTVRSRFRDGYLKKDLQQHALSLSREIDTKRQLICQQLSAKQASLLEEETDALQGDSK